MGCSDQSVPSLSKVAIRSEAGTKSGPPSFVTLSTNSTMALFAGPSFQDGRRIDLGGRGVADDRREAASDEQR